MIKRQDKMKICIFPGTFNPIHTAHIKIGEFALSHYGFEKVIFIPSYIPPHKTISNNLAKHRLNMVKLAVEKNHRFEVSNIEYNEEQPSYTIYTVKKIKAEYNIEEKLAFLIGTDAFINLRTWYKADELKNLVHFIVFPRCKKLNEDDFLYYKENNYDYEFAPMEYIEISSTELRHGKGKNLNKVGEYIKNNGLY